MCSQSKLQLASVIESTWLHVPATQSQIEGLCAEAVHLGLYGVCLPPCWVSWAAKLLYQKKPKIITVVAFPYGYDALPIKVAALAQGASDGAAEVDYVMNVSQYLSEGSSALRTEAAALVKAARVQGVLLKGILETALLSDEQKVESAKVLLDAGVDMIKTSTGTIPGGGAKVKDITLLHQKLGSHVRIKASGEIRSREDALALIQAGACRLGTSRAKAILAEP